MSFIEEYKHLVTPKWLRTALKVFDQNKTTIARTSGKRGIGEAVARKDNQQPFGGFYNAILARAQLTRTYQNFSEEVLRQLGDNEVRNLISRASPMVAKAVADYADAVASGFTWTSDRLEGQEPDTPAQRLLADFLMRLERDHDGIEDLIHQIARSMFIHGGAFVELVIDSDGRTPVLIKSLDPTTAAFRRNNDPLIGEYYELGQEIQFGTGAVRQSLSRELSPRDYNFISFHNDPTIQYKGIQTEPNNPYGTPILDPAVFHVNVLAGFTDKYGKALDGYIWGNPLITVDEEKVRTNQAGRTNPKQAQSKYDEILDDLEKKIVALEPGGVILQSSAVELQGHLNGQNLGALRGLKDIQDVLRREIGVSVQSPPVKQFSNEAVAETHAIEQNKDYAHLVRGGQKQLNPMFTGFFNLILRLNDYPELAEFRLNYTNTAEYKDQAMTFREFREGLLTASQDLQAFVESLERAKELDYIDEEQAELLFAEGMELRRQVNILPREL